MFGVNTIFSIILSLLTNSPSSITTPNKPIEIKPATQCETTEQEIARYEKTMELVQESKNALKNKEYEKAVVAVTDAKRLSGYHGGVKELHAETLTAYLEDTKKLKDCNKIAMRVSYIKTNVPEVYELYEEETKKIECN